MQIYLPDFIDAPRIIVSAKVRLRSVSVKSGPDGGRRKIFLACKSISRSQTCLHVSRYLCSALK